jgi:hypothetical protein
MPIILDDADLEQTTDMATLDVYKTTDKPASPPRDLLYLI